MAGPHQIIRVQVRGHAVSTAEPRTKPVFNVYDFRRTTTTGTPTKANFVAGFTTNILTPLKACLSVSYVTDFTDCRWLDDPLDPFLTAACAQSGTVVGDSLPSVNNAYVLLGTGLRGQSNRGSKHYGPLAESSTTLDALTAGALTLFATFCTALVAGFTDAGGFVYQPFLTSQKQSTFTPSVANVVGNVITTATTRSILGLMKRRFELRRSSI